MAPATANLARESSIHPRRLDGDPGSWRDNITIEELVIESWGQGFLVAALLIMACITISNMRAGIFLHKLILLELFLAMSHGTFCFMSFDGYGWWLSSTAAFLYLSWIVHNLVAWFKIRPFLTVRASRIFIGTLCLTVPPTVLQIVNNFLFFNNIADLYVRVRPFEVLMRDAWWVYACVLFFYVIKTRYTLSLREIIVGHPRFAIMLLAMLLSVIFTVVDVLASVIPSLSAVDGLNPYWKLSLVFKALTDVIILDDFKLCLEKLRTKLVEKQAMMLPKPPPVPPKDYQMKEKAATTTWTTTKSSPTLVAGQSPKVSPRTALRQQKQAGAQVERSKSAKNALARLGTRLSPLPGGMERIRSDIASSEGTPNSGVMDTIHVRMEQFASGVISRRPPSMQVESPLDPTWPRSASLRRALSVRSNGVMSMNARSSRSSMPTLPETASTLQSGAPTPRAI